MPSKYRVKRIFKPLIVKTAIKCEKLGLKPNQITLLTLCFAIMAFISMYIGFILLNYAPIVVALFGVFVLLSGFFDGIDGEVARIREEASSKGGFLDSIVDKYSESMILISYIFYDLREKNVTYFWIPIKFWISIALIGSILVGYARARGEAAGIEDCDIGLAAKSERFLIIGTTAIFVFIHPAIPIFGLIAVASLANLTAVYRCYYLYVGLQKKSEKKISAEIREEITPDTDI